MSNINNMFRDAGLRDVAVGYGFIAQDFITNIFVGKSTLTYEALTRRAWKGFQAWMESDRPENVQSLTTPPTHCTVSTRTRHETVAAVMTSDRRRDQMH